MAFVVLQEYRRFGNLTGFPGDAANTVQNQSKGMGARQLWFLKPRVLH